MFEKAVMHYRTFLPVEASADANTEKKRMDEKDCSYYHPKCFCHKLVLCTLSRIIPSSCFE